MKNYVVLAFLLLLLVFIAGCNSGLELLPSETSSILIDATTEYVPTTRAGKPIILPPKEIELDSIYIDEEYYPHPRSYRKIYYLFDSFFSNLVSTVDLQKWISEYEKTVQLDPQVEANKMMLATFLKDFNIPREVFEAALERYWQASWRNDTSEDGELPNPDIIYTFDNEVINAYYRRENPVEPDWTKVKTYDSYSAYLAENPQ